MRVSHDCRATLARVYHDVRADFNQFYYLSQVQIAETKLRCVCERLRRVGDGFATLGDYFAMILSHEKVFHVVNFREQFATSLRCNRGLCVAMQTV